MWYSSCNAFHWPALVCQLPLTHRILPIFLWIWSKRDKIPCCSIPAHPEATSIPCFFQRKFVLPMILVGLRPHFWTNTAAAIILSFYIMFVQLLIWLLKFSSYRLFTYFASRIDVILVYSFMQKRSQPVPTTLPSWANSSSVVLKASFSQRRKSTFQKAPAS